MPALGITLAACAAMILLVFLCPTVKIRRESINIYWLPPVLGAAVLLLSRAVNAGALWKEITAPGPMNPLKILLLFFSMTWISVFLDGAGFFRWLAERVLARTHGSQVKLFFALYATVSILTVFTSNDIVVLTFTPFICYFARQAKIDPLPYLFGEFIAANSWSMLLIIGNPTNIYLATTAGAGFAEYFRVMLLPTVLGALGALGGLLAVFYKRLRDPITGSAAPTAAPDWPLVGMGLFFLGGCILLMVLSSWIALPMWLVSVCAAGGLFVSALVFLAVRRRGFQLLWVSLTRIPFEMAPFILAMFTLVFALRQSGLTAAPAAWLAEQPVLRFGVASFLASNVMNNIPMSVLFSGLLQEAHAPAAGLYAAVIGSNLGAFFTPIGALAGMMWTQLLRAHGIPFRFRDFVRYGAVAAIAALIPALLSLAILF